MKTVITWASVIIWLIHITVGAGAGYAAVRLWNVRQQPFIWKLGLFLTGYVVEVVAAVVLLFVARGVVFTLKFSAVLFTFTLASDLLRVALIVYVIKGPDKGLANGETSGAKEPDFWRREFREAVREELAPLRDELEEVKHRLDRLEQ